MALKVKVKIKADGQHAQQVLSKLPKKFSALGKK